MFPRHRLTQYRRALCVLVFYFMSCRQIPWDKDENKLLAWKEARTGFPWIDAAMTQLKEEGCVKGTHHRPAYLIAVGYNSRSFPRGTLLATRLKHIKVQLGSM